MARKTARRTAARRTATIRRPVASIGGLTLNIEHVIVPNNWLTFVLCPGFRLRKNQKDLTSTEWTTFKAAVKEIKKSNAASPKYTDFVNAHQHQSHNGTAHAYPYFLPWHREFLLKFEDRLRQVDPSVTVPYWDWTVDRKIPAPLNNAAEWGVTRSMTANSRISTSVRSQVNSAMAATTFGPSSSGFHGRMNGPHGSVHVQVGGQMANIQNSPSDVLFWLHHGFIDKVWNDWQLKHPGKDPTNAVLNQALLPTSLFSRTGKQVMSTSALRYTYANGIQGTLERLGSTNPINGSNNSRNKIPRGTIVVCKTTRGKFSKFRIDSYGYNLRLRWTTYNRCGTVFSQGTRLRIRGTWSCDLDLGVESSVDGDFWWRQRTSVTRELSPLGGAQVAVYDGPFTYHELRV